MPGGAGGEGVEEMEEMEGMGVRMRMGEVEGPAPDIWVWGLHAGKGFLPHVRRRARLF